MWSFWVSRVVCNLLASIYPTWASYQAVLSGKPEQHKQWLMYWIVYTHFAVLEIVADPLVSWLPLYWEAKAALVVWLTLYGGATTLYNRVLTQFLQRYEGVIDARLESLQAAAQERGSEVLGQVVDSVRGRGTQLAAVGLQWLSTQPGAAAAAAQAAAAAASQPPPAAAGARAAKHT